MSDKLRATGRTFRMLLRAMLKLSEGNNVIITADTECYSMGLAIQFMSLDPDSQLFKYNKKSNGGLTLTFINGNTATFTSHRELRELREGRSLADMCVFSDHYDKQFESMVIRTPKPSEHK